MSSEVERLLDTAASEPALASCRPDWTATQDATVHATSRLVQGPVVVDTRLVRAGKKTITVVANIYDGRGVEDLDQLRSGIDSPAPARALEGGLRPPARGAAVSAVGPKLAAKGLLTFARIPGTSAAGMDDYDPGKWLRDAADHSVIDLELRDAGNNDQLLALATVLLQRPPV